MGEIWISLNYLFQVAMPVPLLFVRNIVNAFLYSGVNKVCCYCLKCNNIYKQVLLSSAIIQFFLAKQSIEVSK